MLRDHLVNNVSNAGMVEEEVTGSAKKLCKKVGRTNFEKILTGGGPPFPTTLGEFSTKSLCKPRNRCFDSIVHSNLLLLEPTITRFG